MGILGDVLGSLFGGGSGSDSSGGGGAPVNQAVSVAQTQNVTQTVGATGGGAPDAMSLLVIAGVFLVLAIALRR